MAAGTSSMVVGTEEGVVLASVSESAGAGMGEGDAFDECTEMGTVWEPSGEPEASTTTEAEDGLSSTRFKT